MLKQTSINDLLRAHSLGSCAVGHTDRRTDGRIALFKMPPWGRCLVTRRALALQDGNTFVVSRRCCSTCEHCRRCRTCDWLQLRCDTIRYDTRCYFTCSRKPTRVSLIYRTETLWEIHVISPGEERKAMVGRILQKVKVSSLKLRNEG